MAHSNLSPERFHSEETAVAYVEAMLWPNGPSCPHCGAADRLNKLEGQRSKPSKTNPEGKPIYGLWKCYHCREQFTVRIGTIFEDSHLPLRLWLQAIYLLCSSKKGFSTRQLQRTLGCGMKTAWHLSHRIRFIMDQSDAGPIGGVGKIVEADETFLTKSKHSRKGPGYQHKVAVMSLVERGGAIRSVKLNRSPNKNEVDTAIRAHVHPESTLHTDGAQYYKGLLSVAAHHAVEHSKHEYARDGVHVNTLEGYFSVLKRGMVGIYQHVEEQHVHRYLAEFDFWQTNREKVGVNDLQRAEIALKQAKGRRLTYATFSAEQPTEEIPF
jgi:transposase-like protein